MRPPRLHQRLAYLEARLPPPALTPAQWARYLEDLERGVRVYRRVAVLLEDRRAPPAASARVDALVSSAWTVASLVWTLRLRRSGMFLNPAAVQARVLAEHDPRAELRSTRARYETWWRECAEGPPTADSRDTWLRFHSDRLPWKYQAAIERVAAWGTDFDPDRATLGELVAAYLLPRFEELKLEPREVRFWLTAPWRIPSARPDKHRSRPREPAD